MTEHELPPALILEGLKTSLIGQRILYYPSLTSTNEIAGQEARSGAPEGTVIIADRQTVGRGRLSRLWMSPAGNIALSIILYPHLSHLPSLNMLACLAVAHSIERVCGLEVQLKWPNDVLINEQKVCGILIENSLQAQRVIYSVIGIGINVNLDPADYSDIEKTATSLNKESDKEISRPKLIRCLLMEIEKLYLSLKDGNSPYEEWRNKLLTLGRRIRAESSGKVLEGIAETVDTDGNLLVRLADGNLTKISAGEVTLRNI